MRETVAANRSPLIWRRIDPRFDNGAAWRCSIGLLALATDMACEAELPTYLSMPGVHFFSSRVAVDWRVDVAALHKLRINIRSAMDLLLPGRTPDVIALGCTAGAVAMGCEEVVSPIESARPGARATTPMTAALKALSAFGARRIALVTPYLPDVNALMASFLQERGFELTSQATFEQPGDLEMNRIDPTQIAEVCAQVALPHCDAIFVSCAGLRTAAIIDQVEAVTGRPVVTSIQAMAWDCLRLAGVHDKLDGVGMLLRCH
jgi:maleate isomerase